jgi:hypothetical protein
MVGSYLLQMDLRSRRVGVGSSHRSTRARAGRDPEDHGKTGRENANGESHDAPRLGPPPPPPPLPPMTPAEVLATRRETACALELMVQTIGGLTHGFPVATTGTGAVPAVLRGPVLIRTS